MRELLATAHEHYPAYLSRLGELVSLDSGSLDAAGVDRVGDRVADYLAEVGMEVTRPPVAHPAGHPLGRAVLGRLTGPRPGPRLLLVAHMDTVFAPGTAAARPLRVEAGRWARGPGVSDDKGGLLAGVAALQTIAPAWECGEIVMYCGPDEEIGSPGSRPLLESLAREADAALCLECARADGSIVSGRKGVADVEIVFSGRSAHAGIDRASGANAAVASARAAVEAELLNGRWRDVSVNVGLIHSGERPNVVPDQARLVLDVRAELPASFEAVIAAIQRIASTPHVAGVDSETAVVAPSPPWATAPEDAWLAEAYLGLADELGIALSAVTTGGSADANLVAAQGVPTLDGLGPVGGDDHSVDEWLDLESVVPRVALLSGLLVGAARSLAPIPLRSAEGRPD